MSHDQIVARRESALILLRLALTAGVMGAVSLYPLMVTSLRLADKTIVGGLVLLLCGAFTYAAWRALK